MLHAIVTSDWHLDSLANHFPNSVQMQLEVIDRIYQYAVQNGIKYVIIPGDISDKDEMPDDTKRSLLQHFLRYEGVVESIYIGGNHDWRDTTSTSMDLINTLCEWKFLKSLKVYLTPEQFELEGVLVNALPYPATESIKSDRPCLNLCHTETVGAIGDNGRPLKAKHSVSVADGDFTVSGHIHLHQFLKKKRFLYCGNPYQKTFGETDAKGFCELKAVERDGVLKVKYEYIETKPGFSLQTIIINEQADFSTLKVNPNIRYRLYVGETVVVPSDLRVRIPNIAQILSSTKSQSIVLEQKHVTALHPSTGLKTLLKAEGASKKQVKHCEKLLDKALLEIGF